jgi:hypothetical protein
MEGMGLREVLLLMTFIAATWVGDDFCCRWWCLRGFDAATKGWHGMAWHG